MEYVLQIIEQPSTELESKLAKEKTLEQIETEKKEILRARQQFAPTLEELRMKQKRDIVQYNSPAQRHRNMLMNSVQPT